MWLKNTVPFVYVDRVVFRIHVLSGKLAVENYNNNGLLLFGVGVLNEGLFGVVFEQNVVGIRV